MTQPPFLTATCLSSCRPTRNYNRLFPRYITNPAARTQDGFHYSKAALSRFNDPDLAFRRRGAPFTFDVAGFLRLVMTLKKTPVTSAGEPEVVIHAPSFDHAIQDPVIEDIEISSRMKVVVIEGNYVLLNEGQWGKVADLMDEKFVLPQLVRLRVPALLTKASAVQLVRGCLARRRQGTIGPSTSPGGH